MKKQLKTVLALTVAALLLSSCLREAAKVDKNSGIGRDNVPAETKSTDTDKETDSETTRDTETTSDTSETKEAERGIVDIETLTHTNEQLIQTLDEVQQIQKEGREKRIAAEAELGRIENELKTKLIGMRS